MQSCRALERADIPPPFEDGPAVPRRSALGGFGIRRPDEPGPSLGARSILFGHPAFLSGSGTHGCACGASWKVDKYVSFEIHRRWMTGKPHIRTRGISPCQFRRMRATSSFGGACLWITNPKEAKLRPYPRVNARSHTRKIAPSAR